MRHLVAFVSGVLFAVGLCIAGMTSPDKVIGFLDLAHWDASLLFTMVGALSVTFVGWRIRARMARPIAGASFPDSPPQKLDARLFAGAALFGVGWGLGGFCPGPMIVSVGGGVRAAFIVVPALLVGMLLFHVVERLAKPAAIAGEEELPTR